MHKLDSHHFMPAYLCVHRPQSRTAIRHSFCSALFDSLMDSQIEFGRSCRSGRAADTSWYRQMADTLAHDMEACDEQAAAIINGESPAAYAANMNYGTFDVESVAKLDTSYTLVDADTVSYMVRQQPDLLPQVSVNPGRAETWARRKITSAMTQSILQGESVPDAARRIRSVVEMDRRASLRAARTALTGAENAGRMGSYRRASGMGIELRKKWMATLDSRTRDSHRELDGEKADIDGRFSNGLSYPGDPTGPASEVWNCRCTMVAALPGHDVLRDRNTSKLETSYEEWKAGRDPKKPKPADRTMASFFQMPGTIAKLNSSGVSMAEARKRLTEQLREYGISSGSFRKLSRGDQQKALDAALTRESGALNNSNDPQGTRRQAHADRYYEEVRNRNSEFEIAAVSSSSGIDKERVRKAYEHVFVNEHDLATGHHRFDPDYNMAESWQRLREGKNVHKHDITMIEHEAREAEYMERGMSYSEAHIKTCEDGYNYQKELDEWREGRKE